MTIKRLRWRSWKKAPMVLGCSVYWRRGRRIRVVLQILRHYLNSGWWGLSVWLRSRTRMNSSGRVSSVWRSDTWFTVGLAQVPLMLDWNEGGNNVAIVGSFTAWSNLIYLHKGHLPDWWNWRKEWWILHNSSSTTRNALVPFCGWRRTAYFKEISHRSRPGRKSLQLCRNGRVLYLGRYRIILWNWVNIRYSILSVKLIVEPEPFIQEDMWTRRIPDYLDYIPESKADNEKLSSSSSLNDAFTPPTLPRQLEKPFWNENRIQKDDLSVLPRPAHVLPYWECANPGCIESFGCGS